MLLAQMLQMSWCRLFWRSDSALTRWFRTRTEGASGRMRWVMVVALARKLLVALWRYATTGTVPKGEF
jgi:transposase